MNHIFTLTLCPAYDLHCRADRFEMGRENLARITSLEAGGKGVNISRALSAFSVPSTAIVALGAENSADFCRRLEEDSLSYTAVTVPGRIRENITLHTADCSETRISFPGFCADESLLDSVKEKLLPLVKKGDFVTLTGRLPDGVSTAPSALAFLAILREAGARVVVDSRSFGHEDLLAARPYLIKPNSEEVAACLGREAVTKEQRLTAAQSVRAQGVENVMISLGEEGAILACEEGVYSCRPPKIKAVSTIGAGDSMIAGFLSAAAEGKKAPDCLRRAVAFGSAACLREGTRPPTAEDIRALLDSVSVQKERE